MSHMVLHRSPDGAAMYHQTESLEEAARHVEELRNAGQGADARIFRMEEIPIEVKTYYRVELPVEASAPVAPAPVAEAPAPSPAPAKPAKGGGDASAAAPASEPVAAVKPEAVPAGANANGGRFGLFGKG